MPDAEAFGDTGSHTLGNIYKQRGTLALPHLYAMGLGNIDGSELPAVAAPTAAYCRAAEKTKAKDTTSGHWEIAGIIMDEPFRTFPDGFPRDVMDEYETLIGRRTIGNEVASGTEIIDRLGAEHMKTGFPIIYTSADSVFQVAAHEDVIPIAQLYEFCEKARAFFVGERCVGRVIARPFTGAPGAFKRTERRKDYSFPPIRETILDKMQQSGLTTLGIGKIEDIFSQRGVAHVNHTTNNTDGIRATINALRGDATDSLIFTNLVDFDMLYGHRNDVPGYAAALEAFDKALPDITAAMQPDDLLIITADHGCDPTTPSTDHSREYIPCLFYGAGVKAVNLHTLPTFADIGATVYDYLGLGAFGVGTSCLPSLRRG